MIAVTKIRSASRHRRTSSNDSLSSPASPFVWCRKRNPSTWRSGGRWI